MSSGQELRVVLLGRTGVGKSSLGNTLLGKDVFLVENSFAAVTFKCQWEQADRFGTRLQVTDTPGVSDTDLPEDEVIKEIAKCIAVAAPGPHVVLMVLRCDRPFTKEEYEAYQSLKKLFGDGIKKHMILVFAGADSLGGSLEDAVGTAPETLKEVISDAGERYYSVNNKASREERDRQAEVIVKAMRELVSRNGGAHFTSTLGDTVNEQVETEVQKRMATNRESHETALTHTREDIVQEKAEPGFFKKLLKAVGDALIPVVAKFATEGVEMLGKIALSKCSVM